MHDSMQYDWSKVKVKATSSWLSAIVKRYFSSAIYNGGWQMIRGQYVKLIGAGF